MSSPITILVSGMIAADPWQGGATWAVLQYVLGLRRLGYEVCLVEPIPEKALQPAGSSLDASENARYFRRVMAQFGLERNSALLLAGGRETVGLSYDQLGKLAPRTRALLNISGMLADEELLAPIPIRVYLDIDPAFNQLWQAAQGIDMRFGAHTHFVTIGLSMGDRACPVPTCGLTWEKTFQPIVLAEWPVATQITLDALTTVGNWRGYGCIDYQGVSYGQKAHSLRPFFALPGLTPERFVLALAIHPEEVKDLEALTHHGWHLLDPARVAHTPARYRQFIQGSKAEFGLAKSGYVLSQCGWFSDRSVCYLASGRPVLAQDTAFSRFLPTGEGLLAFRTQEEALAGIEQLRSDYAKHARKARAIAEEFFDSAKVLPQLLKKVGAC
jgi:hypothetical protein